MVIVYGGRELGLGSGVGAGHCGVLRGWEGLSNEWKREGEDE